MPDNKVSFSGELDTPTPTLTHRSPVVGRCARHGIQRTRLAVMLDAPDDAFNGDYCLVCYSQWVAGHVTKLDPPV